MQKHVQDEPVEHLTYVGETMLKHTALLEKHGGMLLEHKVKL